MRTSIKTLVFKVILIFEMKNLFIVSTKNSLKNNNINTILLKIKLNSI